MIRSDPNRVFSNTINPIQSMMLFLKRNPSLLRFSSYFTSSAHNPLPNSQIVEDYLIESCGFSPEKAASASKYLKFTSPSKPDSVKHFLKHQAGFSDSDILSLISRNFRVLSADVDNVMGPNLRALRKISSWSDSEQHQLIISNPNILIRPYAISRLEFWKNFFNGDMSSLFQTAKTNTALFNMDVDKGVAQRIAFLKEYGFSLANIEYILVRGEDGFFTRSIESMKELIRRVEDLNLPRESKHFIRALLSISRIGLGALDGKMEIYKGYGWSETEFLALLQKTPTVVRLSEENIREKMEFLVGRAGCEPCYITRHPQILLFSLEKRLMPRTHVMNILKSANLLGRKIGLLRFVSIGESYFIEKIILGNKEKVPELHEIYSAACAGRIRV